MLLALVLAGALSAASAAPPGAPPEGSGGDLVLRAEAPSKDLSVLTPGDRAAWLMEAHLEHAPTGSLHLRLSGSGDLVDHANGLEVSVRTCTEPFASSAPESRCPGQERDIVPTSRLADIASVPGGGASAHEAGAGSVWALADLVSGDPRHVMVTLGIPGEATDDRSLQGLTGRAGVGLYAAGEQAAPPAPPPAAEPGGETPPVAGEQGLSVTGADLALWLAGAVLLIVLGILAVRSSHTRRRRGSL